ncbi:HlyD family secretion protein [Paenibacillus validus]|uniref:HlyD family efflux transporter periplasmic adaptor subunit n=1 Tax=Paenibacillus validus TaxID=44253 RepID=A0A7X3CVB8_9BACL|nr:efflux RND transporter periplasmic adaptor subunit [Paenibacillus validus]MUG72939.1 HlyD family efflux transporter periplasmic adaptor subunit [Paenibacillus validus]
MTAIRMVWAVLLAVLLISASGVLYMFSKGEEVKVISVTQADLVQYVQATGKVKPKDERKFYAQTNGKLLHVYIKAGDKVREKQVLAEIDPSDTQFKLQQLELQLEQVQADWNKMQEGPKPEEVKLLEESIHQGEIKLAMITREWNKLRNDYDTGTALNTQLQQKEDEMKLAQSALNAAPNNLALIQQGPSLIDRTKYDAKVKEIQLQQEQLEKDLLNMQVVSNRSGTVIDLTVQEGQIVERGRELLTLADLSQIEIISDVKEAQISQIFMNQAAVIEGSALGEEQYKARVIKMAPIAKASQDNQGKKAVVAVTLSLDEAPLSCFPDTRWMLTL